ncbi:hypothetical protein [Amphritea balenae]|uniref:Uncharacterized protein n=1 Tax=Amphritea balenae TaxID=452629 RepID=A0A3P1SR93_9GAMM|nr:hypothetical protein [Amphritea balenae]RRC99579.1 hypothetical protein EHS89_08730 [Amphritea balenae]GGK78239.1 hypothetical protein GCM10007941_30390 [Amphritea balenae]
MNRNKLIKACAWIPLAFPLSLWASLEPGSVVIYSDGDVKKLLQRDEQSTLWEDQRKRRYKRSYLPYFPVLEYRRFDEQSSGYNQFVSATTNVELIPFNNEDYVQFNLTRQDLYKGSKKRLWQCAYSGNGHFSLGNKKYSTEKYRCKRFSIKKTFTYRLKEEIRFYYSPELDLVMKQVKTNSVGDKSRVEVVRILSPERATAKRIARAVYKQKADR